MIRALKIEAIVLWAGITVALAYRHWPAWTVPLLPSLWINVPLISVLTRREALREWGLKIPDLASTARHVVAFTALLVPASLLILRLIGAIDLTWHGSPRTVTVSLFQQLLWVALPEEVFFRGYLWRRMAPGEHERVPHLHRFATNATLFAATHYCIHPGMWALATWFPGLYFTWLRCRTKSLLAPVLCHGIANTLLFAATDQLP
jgi:membrane protease YdiL (CAAX protease family)